MKYLFLLAGIFIVGSAAAQNDEIYYLQKQIKKSQQKKTNSLLKHQSPVVLAPQLNNYSEKDLTYTLPNGNKAITLSQDNMPCVVPDMRQFNMPFIVPEKQNYNMPLVKK